MPKLFNRLLNSFLSRRTIIKIIVGGVIIGVLIFLAISLWPKRYIFIQPTMKANIFEVQAIDTMKYSRDRAREKLNDPSFDTVINAQVKLIADTGATHVSIATPYDEEFIPILTRWVLSARAHNLSVWFRGNFSGWENWFDYQKITPNEHKTLLGKFIVNHANLFESGDLFSPCPECENGGPGDPRRTGEGALYRQFLIDEYNISQSKFRAQGKSIKTLSSMNGDIAREIMTPASVKALGGTILIDHYVDTPERFSKDISALADKLKANIGLGEFGAPVPDLNGNLSEPGQADFVGKLLKAMYEKNNIVPIVNYWILNGGTTKIVNDSGTPRSAYFVLKDYFSAPSISGNISDPFGVGIDGVEVSVAGTDYKAKTGAGGFYQVFLPKPYTTVNVMKDGYQPAIINIADGFGTSTERNVTLEPSEPTWWFMFKEFIYSKLSGVKSVK